MKKEYVNPETVVIDLKVSQSLLAGSLKDKEATKDSDGFFNDAARYHDNGDSDEDDEIDW